MTKPKILILLSIFFVHSALFAQEQSNKDILSICWQKADKPLQENWKLEAGEPTMFSIEKSAFTPEICALRIDNISGQKRILSIPFPSQLKAGLYQLTIKAGVKEKSKGPLLFYTVGSALDVRADNSKIYLTLKPQNAERKTIKLGSYTPGQILDLECVIDATEKQITQIKIDGKSIDSICPVPWSRKGAPKSVNIIATTPSAAPIFCEKISLIELPDSREKTKKIKAKSKAKQQAKSTKFSKAPWRQRPIPKMIEEESRTGVFVVPGNAPETLNLEIDEERIKNTTFPITFYFTHQQLQALPKILKDDPKGINYWNKLKEFAQNCVKSRGISFRVKSPARYTYNVAGCMRSLAFVYLITGNKDVGFVLKEMMLDVAKRPMSFWIHPALRRFDPAFPVAALEGATLTNCLSTSFHWAQDLFNADEKKIILDAIRIKGLYPCLRWLERTKGHNNWLAVIATGALSGSVLLQEKECIEYSKKRLKFWTTLVEDDGSYSEPVAYFTYGAISFIRGALVPGTEETKKLALDTPLKDSLNYMAYNYVKARTQVNHKSGYQVNFGDGDFPGRPNHAMCFYLAQVFNQGLGLWLINEFTTKNNSYGMFYVIEKLMFANSDLKPVSPEELKLPMVKSFDCGVGFIRDGWKGLDDTMLAMRSGDGGKTKYCHDYPNRNAIILFEKGEYMLVESGRTSYRSPMHYAWDMQTKSSNAITFWDDCQKKNSPAQMLLAQESEHAAVLISEAKATYRKGYKVKKMRRRIMYLKDIKVFVMWDDIVSPDTKIKTNWRLFFGNFDLIGKLKEESQNTVHFSRNGVSLKVFAQASDPAGYSFGEGIMHHGYCYFPGDPNEGKMGSSKSWTCSSKGLNPEINFYSCFGAPGWDVKMSANTMILSKGNTIYNITFNNNQIEAIRTNNDKRDLIIKTDDKTGITEQVDTQ